jgi:phosphohistidine phosphatase SixA
MGTMRIVVLALGLMLAAAPAHAEDTLWPLLQKGGQILMLRHATAPGTYDPPGFQVDDCSTQRNLDEGGRAEARRLGEALKARGVPVGRVLSSRWCRCLETARLAFGRVDPWPALDSLRRGDEDERVKDVRRFVSRPFTGPNVVLVTHQFNIREVTGLPSIASGESVVLTPLGNGDFRVAGRLPAPAAR